MKFYIKNTNKIDWEMLTAIGTLSAVIITLLICLIPLLIKYIKLWNIWYINKKDKEIKIIINHIYWLYKEIEKYSYFFTEKYSQNKNPKPYKNFFDYENHKNDSNLKWFNEIINFDIPTNNIIMQINDNEFLNKWNFNNQIILLLKNNKKYIIKKSKNLGKKAGIKSNFNLFLKAYEAFSKTWFDKNTIEINFLEIDTVSENAFLYALLATIKIIEKKCLNNLMEKTYKNGYYLYEIIQSFSALFKMVSNKNNIKSN
ncbi:hypothetical protein [Spiroplasma chrysopicola]|uniref:Uncharacterized protein n=1 Tax=Spiroplasma chrysopicola DF-1 TaxID=1276227 RepID=R4UH48_9MOLU|nr:hypothetical protein [Spiroplasma chrysopicola]AGM24636.1 hypothetical protein SCHRY_v1c00490 [Spiroplasma chrysopicola DF-1]